MRLVTIVDVRKLCYCIENNSQFFDDYLIQISTVKRMDKPRLKSVVYIGLYYLSAIKKNEFNLNLIGNIILIISNQTIFKLKSKY